MKYAVIILIFLFIQFQGAGLECLSDMDDLASTFAKVTFPNYIIVWCINFELSIFVLPMFCSMNWLLSMSVVRDSLCFSTLNFGM